jgi:hypothetical protein
MRFVELNKIIDKLEENMQYLAVKWIENETVNKRLTAMGISPKFFKKHFGIRVINHALGVIRGEHEVGDCPVLHVMLAFFEAKHFQLNDLYVVCAGLRNTILTMLADQGLANSAMINEVTELMDTNFEGVMIEYIARNYYYHVDISNDLCSPCQDSVTATSSHYSSSKLSAKQYLATIDVDHTDMDELKELEQDACTALEQELLDNEHIAILVAVFKKYSFVLANFEEFGRIGTALNILLEILEQLNIESFDEGHRKNIAKICESLIDDLKGWRDGIFTYTNADDIHWLDEELISLMAQFGIVVCGSSGCSCEEAELF